MTRRPSCSIAGRPSWKPPHELSGRDMSATVTHERSRSTDQGLLEQFVEDIVVDDYGPATAEESRRIGSKAAALAVAALIAFVVFVSLLNTRLSTDERRLTRDALAERISTISTDVQRRQANVDETRTTVDGLQAQVLAAASEVDSVSADEWARLTALSGASALAGPGVIVTVDDAPDAQAGSLNRVLDRDLQDIVNALWRSGATGVAVNDQRLTNSTAIRAAGEAILVNYQPLTRPYHVYAVGTSTAGTGDSGLQRLLGGLSRDYGLVTDVTTGDVALPAGELRSPRFAKAAPPGSPGAAGPSTSAGVSSQ